MWQRIEELMVEGRAFLVHSSQGEQRLAFKTLGHDWTPVDFDGVTLMRRREGFFQASGHPGGSGAEGSDVIGASEHSKRLPTAAFSSAEVARRRERRRRFRPRE